MKKLLALFMAILLGIGIGLIYFGLVSLPIYWLSLVLRGIFIIFLLGAVASVIMEDEE